MWSLVWGLLVFVQYLQERVLELVGGLHSGVSLGFGQATLPCSSLLGGHLVE